MKNKELFSQLIKAVSDHDELVAQEAERQKIAEEEKIRYEARKKAEKMIKNFDKKLFSDANQGYRYYIVEIIFQKNINNGEGGKIEDWSINDQELFKLLEERGYEPELRKRSDVDRPTAYTSHDVPYAMIVSWE
jgi:hypothetical protein